MSFLLNTFRGVTNALTYIPRRIYRAFRPAVAPAAPPPLTDEQIVQNIRALFPNASEDEEAALVARARQSRMPQEEIEEVKEQHQLAEENQPIDGRQYSAYNDEINDYIAGPKATVNEAWEIIRGIHEEFSPETKTVFVDFHYFSGAVITYRLFGDYKSTTGVGMLRAAMTSEEHLTEEERKEQEENYIALIDLDQIVAAYVYRPADNRQRIPNRYGGQYRFLNTSKFDLSRYDIYTEDQVKDRQYRQHNCLYIALVNLGIDEETLNYLKLNFFKHDYTAKNDFPALSKIINKRIAMHYYVRDVHAKNGVKKRIKYFGEEDLPIIDIALLDNHFFVFEETNATRFSAVNYEEVCHRDDFMEIVGRRRDRPGHYSKDKRRRRIHSLELVTTLKVKGLIDQYNPYLNIDIPKTYIRGEEMNIVHGLTTDVGVEFKPTIGEKRNKRLAGKTIDRITYADTEAYVNGNKHELLAIAFVNAEDPEPTVIRTKDHTPYKAICRMLDTVPHKGIVYFHNLKYDFNLIAETLTILSTCESNGNLYSVKVKHNNKTIELRDSFKIINMALSKFGKTFGVQSKKDCIAYGYYTKENQDVLIDPEVYRNMLRDEDKEHFDPAPYTTDGLFDPYAYYMDYLKQDVLTLRAGMIKFNEHLSEIDPAINVNDYLTIGSIALSASYDDLSKFTPVNNTLRAFFNQCYTGGDVQVNDKYRKVHITDKIVDIDAVSLYPSAMIRAGNEGWFNTGVPQLRTDDWEKYSTFMNVRITKVNKKIQPPLICYRDLKNGNIHDYNTEGRIYQLHSILLKAYIEMLDIEYEIINGIQFRGPPIKFSAIEKFFDERLKAKKDGNTGLSTVLKLIMNATYGKTIEKQRFDENRLVKAEDLDTFMLNNYAYFNTSKKCGQSNYSVNMKKIDQTYGIPYVGATILAMAKRIMFEVREVVHETGGDFIYTDTDSGHIKLSDFHKANELFKRKYGRSLDDKSGLPGTFHNDLPGDAPYADEAYFFGKKSYAHKINGKWHVTMKGITAKGIEHIRQTGDIEEDLLKPLSKGEAVKILMNPPGFAPSFEIEMDNVHFKTPFYRTVQF